MATGTVLKFLTERSFGFLQPDDGEANLFFHLSRCADKIAPEPGARVSFELAIDRLGRPTAVDVKTLAED